MAFDISKAFLVVQFLAIMFQSRNILAFGSSISTVTQSQSAFTTKPVLYQGAVYCKPCNYKGNDTLVEATPIEGAVVRLQCNKIQNKIVKETKTNKNGYFSVMPPKQLTTEEFEEYCAVFLVSSPKASCNIPTNLHDGLSGAVLKGSYKVIPPQNGLKFDLFACI